MDVLWCYNGPETRLEQKYESVTHTVSWLVPDWQIDWGKC